MTKDEVQQFTEWVYPKLIKDQKEIAFYFRKKENWLKMKFASFKKIHWAEFEKVTMSTANSKNIQSRLSVYMKKNKKKFAPLMLKDFLNKYCNKMSLNSFYSRAGINALSDPPRVRWGPSRSKGHYDSRANTIWVDLGKNQSPTDVLGTLYFEAGNASQKEELNAIGSSTGSAEEKAWKVIGIEFKSSDKEINRILRKNKAANVEDLVKAEKFGIPKKIWQKYNKASYSKTSRVKMPSVGELKDQDMRTALYWFQIRGWGKKDKIAEFGYRPHTPGKKESTLEQEIKKYSRK